MEKEWKDENKKRPGINHFTETEQTKIRFLKIANIENLVRRLLVNDGCFTEKIKNKLGNQSLDSRLYQKAEEAYDKGFDITDSNISIFSTHGMWMLLNQKKAPDYILCSEEVFISKVEGIDGLTKQMNALIPWIVLEDSDSEQKWKQLKLKRQEMIDELETLMDETKKWY